jgi:hypothetical protein
LKLESEGYRIDADFTHSLGMEGLLSAEQREQMSRLMDENSHRDAVISRQTLATLDNSRNGVLGSPLTLADRRQLSEDLMYYFSPTWLIAVFGKWTTMVLGCLTLITVICTITRATLYFLSEMVQHGWDGGRTAGRCLLAMCGIFLIPQKMFNALMQLSRHELLQLARMKRGEGKKAAKARQKAEDKARTNKECEEMAEQENLMEKGEDKEPELELNELGVKTTNDGAGGNSPTAPPSHAQLRLSAQRYQEELNNVNPAPLTPPKRR